MASLPFTLCSLGAFAVLVAVGQFEGQAGAEDPAQADAAGEVQAVHPGPILTGRATDEAGRPVEGVTIRLYSGLGTRREGAQATTGPDGVYRFEPLATGAMVFRDDEGQGEAFYFVGLRLEHPVYVSAERRAWWDLEVPIRHGHVETRDFALVPGGRLEGRILTPVGSGWGELHLRIVPLDPAHRNATGWYAQTDHRGRFALEGALTPGEYAVQWNSPGAGYPELGRVTITPGQFTKAMIRLQLRVDAACEATDSPFVPER